MGNLAVSLPVRRISSVFMNGVMWEHRPLHNYIFDVTKFTTLTSLSSLTVAPDYWLKIPSLPTFTKFSCSTRGTDPVQVLVPR
jgi:hypothetical protein